MEANNTKRVDYKKVFAEIWRKKLLYVIVLPITVILASLYIICIPRTYSTEAEIVPESEGPSKSSETLGSLASTFGLNLSSLQSADAITPMLYPDLMDDNGFVSSLFKIKVKTSDNKISTDYFTYLHKYQKSAWWDKAMSWVASLFPSKNEGGGGATKFDPYHLSKDENDVAEAIRANIGISVDKKTGAITITTSAQDPVVCKTLADSTRARLEKFITAYRTKKSKEDYQYYKKLAAEAKAEYEQKRRSYGNYSDANLDVILESVKSKQEDLENEMQLKYNAYSTLSNQMEMARAKVQENTPVFTVIKGAAVPIRPTSPKRVVFVVVWFFIAFFGTTAYILRDIVKVPKQ